MAKKTLRFGERPSAPPRRPQVKAFHPRDRRPNAAARGYGGRWQRYRATFLLAHPLCVLCEAAGKVVPAEHVDHKTPALPADAGFWEPTNHQALCKPCHSRKTIKEDGGLGRPKKVRP